MAGRITLNDVAHAADVSLATASRAINGSPNRRVRADLRERVLAASERLGYTPDANAQAVARGRTTSLGLIVHDIADPYFSAIAAGVARAADAAGFQVTLASTQNRPSREVELVRLLQSQRSRAIILVGGRYSDTDAARLTDVLANHRAAGGAAVVIGQPLPGVDTVAVDNRGGAAALAKRLHDLGYRRPILFGGPDGHLTARARREGFTAVFAELGAPIPSHRLISGGFTHDDGEAAFLQLWERDGGRLDGDVVFAVNDVMALGALAAARDVGAEVPESVALAGFDDIPTLRDVVPRLTTVAIPLTQVGEWATALALSQPEAEARVRTVPAEVVVRDSTPRRQPAV
ncbi:MAG: LacI family transcriptional regulator [Propionibacteriaceae bacterium]|jgi:LacI family transcriptional regulator|nr:LacI family transcriptional regulator [Propionibacteriaceae bacterium]